VESETPLESCKLRARVTELESEVRYLRSQNNVVDMLKDQLAELEKSMKAVEEAQAIAKGSAAVAEAEAVAKAVQVETE
jgi:cystathionine beta-lyase/cystathionine gamma-synthase